MQNLALKAPQVISGQLDWHKKNKNSSQREHQLWCMDVAGLMRKRADQPD